MERLNFLFGVHCHQPVGNFGFVFEKAYKRAYLPFFQCLKEFPDIKIVAHFSGPLLDWIEENQPSFLDFLKEMVERGQVEIIGGGYYEPILPILSEKDQSAQLKLMKKKCQEFFGKKPEGCWIAERVWEPSLPFILSKNGYRAVFLDDFHFLSSGLEDREVFDYFQSYHLDSKVYLFPIKEKYRYLIPFAPVEEVMENFQRDREIYKDSIITMVDDGEKFGIWPGTYKWVWEEKWLKKFFEALSKADFIKTITLEEALSLKKPRGVLHIPTQSYFEMGEWTLPAQKILKYKEFYNEIRERKELKPFLKGGYWRNFFEKYEESFWIYQRMVYVSSYLKDKINLNLLKAQCNCGWWHGIFGGLYLPFLRRAIFSNLIKAEKNKKEGFYKEKEFFVLRDKKFQIFAIEGYGGVLKEIDVLDKSLNITDLLRRRIEAYHFEEKKEDREHASIHDLSFSIEPSFKPDIVNDPNPHLPLIMHFLDEIPLNLNEIQNYERIKIWEGRGEILKRKLGIEIKTKQNGLEITKKIKIDGENLNFQIKVEGNLTKYWAVELPFSFPEGFYKTEKLDFIPFSSPNLFEKPETMFLRDRVTDLKLEIGFKNLEKVCIFPLNTIAKCEEGFEKILQGIIILPIFFEKEACINLKLEV
ncbi:MAG: alpha-amylase/4-alpha-glucanotransferase domain-containing protein [Thermoanaerobaculia bacterium]